MKKIMYVFVIIVITISNMFSQPQKISYQAIIRDGNGNVLQNHSVVLQLDILQGSSSGTIVYSETHSSITNDYGLVNVFIGTGNVNSGDFSSIDWSAGPYYLRTSVDAGSGMEELGVQELVSVPYSFYSAKSDTANVAYYAVNVESGDDDTTNELQVLELHGDTLFISNGNYVLLPQSLDNDPTNELQNLSISNDTLYLSDGGFVYLNTNGAVGNNGEIQFNHNGSLDASPNLYWDITKERLGIGTNTPQGRVVIQQDPNTPDSLPLFEVKDKDGNPVFVVYPDSVHVFLRMDSSKTAGIVGGFAVSGRYTTKSVTEPYLYVTPDSTRIYFNENNSKTAGIVGGFAVSGRYTTKNNSGNEYFLVSGDSTRVYTTGDEGGFGVQNINDSTSNVPYVRLTPLNYFIGHMSGINIAPDTATNQGLYNSVYGYRAGENLTTGRGNFFAGYLSGNNNTTADYNVFIGYRTGLNTTDGHDNVFLGTNAGLENIGGDYDVYIGSNAGARNKYGSYSVNIGINSAPFLENGGGNTFIGTNSAYWLTKGDNNVFIGTDCGRAGSNGDTSATDNAYGNVLMGFGAGYNISDASNNVILGTYSARNIHLGSDNNVILGSNAAGYIQDNSQNNIVIGYFSGYNLSGSGNVFIGNYAGYNETGSNKLYIENTNSSTPLIYGEFDNDKLKFNSNVTVRDFLAMEQATVTVGSNGIVPTDKSYYLVSGVNDGDVIDQFEAGAVSGQVLVLQGNHNGIRIPATGSNIRMSSDLYVGDGDIAMFVWDGSYWVLMSFTDN